MDEPITNPVPTDDLTGYREQYSFYAKNLLADLGLADLPQPERGQLLAGIESLVQKVIMNTLLQNLEPNQVDEAEGILQRGGDEEAVILHFLASTPDIQAKIADSLTELYARIKKEASELAIALGYQPKSPESSAATTPTDQTAN